MNAAATSDMLKVPIGANHLFYGDNLDFLRLLRVLLAPALFVCAQSDRSIANNAACWGDDSRKDISCARLTQPLVLSLRGKTREQVQKEMDAPGEEKESGWLHFLSNYGSGSGSGAGYLNVKFEDGQATIIDALIDASGGSGDMHIIWNAYAAPSLPKPFDRSTRDFARGAYCSDVTRRPRPCKADTMQEELLLSRMAFGSDKAELLRMLNSACSMPGIAGSDGDADCRRLRLMLQ